MKTCLDNIFGPCFVNMKWKHVWTLTGLNSKCLYGSLSALTFCQYGYLVCHHQKGGICWNHYYVLMITNLKQCCSKQDVFNMCFNLLIVENKSWEHVFNNVLRTCFQQCALTCLLNVENTPWEQVSYLMVHSQDHHLHEMIELIVREAIHEV